jgi:hypothetical protein
MLYHPIKEIVKAVNTAKYTLNFSATDCIYFKPAYVI